MAVRTTHFVTLDGMRGVAAIAVVTTHAVPFIGGAILPNASLAVDLFFLLSGFVLSHAYSRRLDDGIGLWGFLAIRFTRLAPLYVIGALLGTALLALNIASGRWSLDLLPTALAQVSLWLMLPSPMPNQLDEVFIVNGPRWSLFYEDVINIVMVLSWGFFRSTARLAIATVLLGLGLALVMRHYHTYELGWSGRTFLAGFLRVGFPFFAGMLLYRLRRAGWKVSGLANLIPFLVLPLFVVAPRHLVIYGLACIGIAFPALVWLGAQLQPPSERLCRFLGHVSYPLYVIHVPILGLVEWGLATRGLAPSVLGPGGALLLLAALVGVSWALARTYDIAARAWLRSKLVDRRRGTCARPAPKPVSPSAEWP